MYNNATKAYRRYLEILMTLYQLGFDNNTAHKNTILQVFDFGYRRQIIYCIDQLLIQISEFTILQLGSGDALREDIVY
jgi:hypothetical protein